MPKLNDKHQAFINECLLEFSEYLMPPKYSIPAHIVAAMQAE